MLYITERKNLMYTVRQVGFKEYQVANFTDYAEPVAVYKVRDNRCSCPARNPCKHQKIVEFFKTLESGAWGFEMLDNGVVQPHHLAMMEIE
jgi:hypothetical protein